MTKLEEQFNKVLSEKVDIVRLQLLEELKAATPVDTGNARDHWRIEGNKIVNPVDYIENLNAGSSKQAPSHFIEKTILAHNGVKPSGTIVVIK